jgi:glycosyltransferase involved in cell wall biosynthesis
MASIDLSLCIIVRDDESIDKAIASARPSGAEIVVVYTGYDPKRVDYLSTLADRVDWFTDCNDPVDEEHEIQDFAMARERSFAAATRGWVGWLDSDDLLVGAEHLGEVLGCAHGIERPRLLGRYDYSLDPLTGEPLIVQWRERIVRNNGVYRWDPERPVHENLVAIDGRNDDHRIEQPVIWSHQRTTPENSGRNLRILKAYGMTHDIIDNAWWHLNMGNELWRTWEYEAAASHFQRYLKLSAWDDEKVLAMLRLSACRFAMNPMMEEAHRAAIEWVHQASTLRPDWFEPYYEEAKLWYMRALQTGNESYLANVVELTRTAAQKAATPTGRSLAHEPKDRSYNVYKLQHDACEMLGDWKGALEAAEASLRSHPADGPMKLARKRYTGLLALGEVNRLVGASRGAETTDARDAGSPTGVLSILIACGETSYSWNPATVAKFGAGGSEIAVIEVGKRLAGLGHSVTVFCDCGAPGLYDGVVYTNNLQDIREVDVLVAWRKADLLEHMPARVKLLWVHDVMAHNASAWNLGLADKVLALSTWHAQELLRRHGAMGLTEDRIARTRNGIDTGRFAPPTDPGLHAEMIAHGNGWGQQRNPKRALYTSSGDRGLLEVYKAWPKIRETVPDAELHVYYGTDLIKRYSPELAERLGRAQEEAGEGITVFGQVDQDTLAKAMLGAGVWLHPSWLHDGQKWTETFCSSAAEALAAGLRVVCSPHGALPETVFQGTFIAESEAPDEAWLQHFALGVALEMLRPEEERQEQAAEARRRYTWDGIAEQWVTMVREILAAESSR